MGPTRRAALVTLGALAVSCKRDDKGLLVFAAASTSDALTDLAKLYGQHVRFSWGASGDLARQIEAGAPADIFLSADRAKVDRLEKSGHIAARRDLLRNRLVVVVSGSSSATI